MSTVDPRAHTFSPQVWLERDIPLPPPAAGAINYGAEHAGRRRYLGVHGRVSQLKWAWNCPGGPKTLTCRVDLRRREAPALLVKGSRVGVSFGGEDIWSGNIIRCPRDGDSVQIEADGDGTRPARFRAFVVQNPVFDDALDLPAVIADATAFRGLALTVDAGYNSLPGTDEVEKAGTITIGDALDRVARNTGLFWQVDAYRRLRFFDAADSAQTGAAYRLTADRAELTRSDEGWVTHRVYRLNGTPDGGLKVYSVDPGPDIARPALPLESFRDLTGLRTPAGDPVQLTDTEVLAAGKTDFAAQDLAGDFTGRITVRHGELLTYRGVPASLPGWRAGMRLRVNPTAGVDEELSNLAAPALLAGETEYDCDSGLLSVLPVNTRRRDFAGVLAS